MLIIPLVRLFALCLIIGLTISELRLRLPELKDRYLKVPEEKPDPDQPRDQLRRHVLLTAWLLLFSSHGLLALCELAENLHGKIA